MSNFTNEQIKRLIYERNSEEIKNKFEKYKNNGHKIAVVWDELVEICGLSCKGPELKQKYNNLLKQFRQKKLQADKSGGEKVTWTFYDDFLQVEAKGTEIVAPGCISSNDVVLISPIKNKRETPIKKKHKTKVDRILKYIKKDNKNSNQLLEKLIGRIGDGGLNARIEKLEKTTEELTKTNNEILDVLKKLAKDK